MQDLKNVLSLEDDRQLSYVMLCSGPTHIKTSYFLLFIKRFSKKILLQDNNLEILVPFLSLKNNAENNV